MTRSKAWVRVIGYGPQMQELVDEFNALKQRHFVLEFTYPDEELLSSLRIVHRDMSPQARQRLKQRKSQLADLYMIWRVANCIWKILMQRVWRHSENSLGTTLHEVDSAMHQKRYGWTDF